MASVSQWSADAPDVNIEGHHQRQDSPYGLQMEGGSVAHSVAHSVGHSVGHNVAQSLANRLDCTHVATDKHVHWSSQGKVQICDHVLKIEDIIFYR